MGNMNPTEAVLVPLVAPVVLHYDMCITIYYSLTSNCIEHFVIWDLVAFLKAWQLATYYYVSPSNEGRHIVLV